MNIINIDIKIILRATIICTCLALIMKIYELDKGGDLKIMFEEYLWYNSAMAEMEDGSMDYINSEDDVKGMLSEESENMGKVKNVLVEKECNEAERKLFMNLANRHNELLEAEKILVEKHNMLGVLKNSISVELKKLGYLKEEVEKALVEYKKEEDEHIKGLRRVYENMKPKDASNIFNEISNEVLLEVMKSMDRERLALILSKMNANKARELTIELANYNRIVKLN